MHLATRLDRSAVFWIQDVFLIGVRHTKHRVGGRQAPEMRCHQDRGSAASWASPGAWVGCCQVGPGRATVLPGRRREAARFQRCRPPGYGGYRSDRRFDSVGYACIVDGRKPCAETRLHSLTSWRPSSPPTPRSPGATGRATGAARPHSTFGTPTDFPPSLRGRACRAGPNPCP